MKLKGLKFSKMHGIGNDYIVVDESKGEIIAEDEKPNFAIEVCTSGFSIGADGVIFVTPASDNGDIRFRIFNDDGTEPEMCGNGIRCFSKFIYDKNIVHKDLIKVETLGGLKIVEVTAEEGIANFFKVDMGLSSFKTSDIPMIAKTDEFLEKELIIDGESINISTINVGNPHAVILTESIDDIDLNKYGPAIESHEAFPEKINVHFIELISKNEIKMLTWERGVGYTHACGTGATSSVLVGYKLLKLNNNVLVHLPGGDLEIEVYEKENKLGAYMKGSATLVFNGEMA
jgi:diaminopimelate epimerase